jgi:hypothetical protein
MEFGCRNTKYDYKLHYILNKRNNTFSYKSNIIIFHTNNIKQQNNIKNN